MSRQRKVDNFQQAFHGFVELLKHNSSHLNMRLRQVECPEIRRVLDRILIQLDVARTQDTSGVLAFLYAPAVDVRYHTRDRIVVEDALKYVE